MKRIIDLHIHTNLSDGVLSPLEVIDEAVKSNVSVIGIADHDTIDAYTDELYDYAKIKGVEIINAVEISTKYKGIGIHVLGYNFDVNNKRLRERLEVLRNARHDYLHNVCCKLNELGYVLNVDELDKIDVVTKAHIADDVINNLDNHNLLLEKFKEIPNRGKFIETIMNEGCPAYVKKETISPKEATDLIRGALGKVVLAHPVSYFYEDNLSDEDILELVREMKSDGIEANYLYVSKDNIKINEIDKWNDFADKYNLNVTVGSDFHCKSKVHPDIGLINENLILRDEMIDNIINWLKN